MALDILVFTAKGQDLWRDALAANLPEAVVHIGPGAPRCDYALVWNPPPEILERQTRLKALFSLGAGVNGLLAMPSLPAHLPLIRMEDVGMAAQMQEYALYIALRQFRSMPHYERSQADGQWSRQPMRTRSDFRIGVLGLGVLGGAVASSLAEFGFSVSGWSRSSKSIANVNCETGLDGLNQLIARSELLILMLPVTEETTGLIGRSRIAALPAGAAIANLSRGELIDDTALLDAIDAGHIAQVYLDVFNVEPLPAGHPYWTHPRVQITPHIAALTPHDIAAQQVADKIRRLETGQSISGIVDRERGY